MSNYFEILRNHYNDSQDLLLFSSRAEMGSLLRVINREKKDKDYIKVYHHIENAVKRNKCLENSHTETSMLHPHRCFHLCCLISPLLGTVWAATHSA